MNRFFGFLKEKLIEAKEENQHEIQNIVNAFDSEPYSKQKMLNYLQEMKTNYLEWNIMIANEASTGLYFSQIHNRTCLLKKAKIQKEAEERIAKNEIVLEQMQKTVKELRKIARLNKDWANSMSSKVQRLAERIDQNDKKNRKQVQQLEREIVNQSTNEESVRQQTSQQNNESNVKQQMEGVKQQQKVDQTASQNQARETAILNQNSETVVQSKVDEQQRQLPIL